MHFHLDVLYTGIDRGDDVDRNMLVGIYERIQNTELKTGADHTSQVRKVEETMVGKVPVSFASICFHSKPLCIVSDLTSVGS